MTADSAVLDAFAKQVGWCERLDAPFTAALLRLAAADIAQGGTAAALVGAWPGDPVADAVPLRLAGGLRALVLTGADPALAACYPPGGDQAGLPAALAAALAGHEAFLRRFLASPPQTNEVGRSAVLLGGFLQAASATGLPLRLLEIGASAGLNMAWDRYAYRLGGADWGNRASPVRLEPAWDGPPPLLDTPVQVASRAACDVAPIDLASDEARLRLRSYIWPEQPERLARLDAAIGVARAMGVAVARADAGAWVRARLAEPAPGCTTVLYHSVMWQYMPAATQAAIHAALVEAGARASAAAPLAWLRFEPPGAEAQPELRLTLWPGGGEHLLARAHPHGSAVRWLG